MCRKRILVTWISGHDLDSCAAALPKKKQQQFFLKPYYSWDKIQKGPVRSLVEKEDFDEIHLISNYDKKQSEAFSSWIGGKPHLHMVVLDSPVNYQAIFDIVDKFLKGLSDRIGSADLDLCIHLSPGTPAMTAIWVLLGKSRYPATFYQTYKNDAFLTEIPFDLDFDYIPQLLRNTDLNLQHLAARSPSDVRGFEGIIGESKTIRESVGRAARAALRSVSILLIGESGTGKEMFARAIHKGSPRKNGPFVPLNCAAIPQSLLESELFGHTKGAFTGATEDRSGAFEQADGGTLFLDEIGECDPDLQAKLLRILQPPAGMNPSQRIFKRIGDTKEITSDVRVISATNKNLIEAIQENEFREDLFYRLAVITVSIPPLRERRKDIQILAENFLKEINLQFAEEEPGYEPRKFSKSGLSYLKQHSWPGNVRELYNVILQASVMSESTLLSRKELAASSVNFQLTKGTRAAEESIGNGFNLEKHIQSIQKQYIEKAMEESNGVKKRAAELLGYKNYQRLDAQIQRLKIRWRNNL